METVAPGYSRPQQRGAIPSGVEALIAGSCPGAVVEPWQLAPNRHPYWGPWFRVGVGYAADPAVRHHASSGGAITALASYALASGQVDRVVHVLADPDRPTRNLIKVSTTAAEVLAGAGSRYASSSPLADIERILGDGGALAFVGKPCDVSALRRLGRFDRRVSDHVRLALSFFCAGVPSHAAADRVLGAMGVRSDQVTAFRYRGDGWPGSAAATLRDGRVAKMSYADSWGGYLSKEVQFRCKICPDGVGGVADIACADAWYGDERGYPSFEEQDGRSLIITRTAAGEALLDQAIAAGAMRVESLEVGEVEAMQPSQARRKRLIMSRTAALSATLQPAPLMSGLSVGEAAKRAGRLEFLKSFLGAVRRIVMRRR